VSPKLKTRRPRIVRRYVTLGVLSGRAAVGREACGSAIRVAVIARPPYEGKVFSAADGVVVGAVIRRRIECRVHGLGGVDPRKESDNVKNAPRRNSRRNQE